MLKKNLLLRIHFRTSRKIVKIINKVSFFNIHLTKTLPMIFCSTGSKSAVEVHEKWSIYDHIYVIDGQKVIIVSEITSHNIVFIPNVLNSKNKMVCISRES